MPSPTRTRQQLKTQALINLTVIASGQGAEAEDMATVELLVDPLFEQLAATSVINIADPDEYPLAIFLPLAQLLANEAANAFGQHWSPERKLTFEQQLRRLGAARPTGETLRAEYF